MEGKVIVSVNDLSVVDDGNVILNNISFNVKQGEAFALVGASGSGKSTLAKVLAGQCNYSSGEFFFDLPPTSKRLFISQQHDFRDFSSRAYYQQRFDSNYGDSSTKVETLFHKIEADNKEEIFHLLKIESVLQSRLIELSNGEGKRVQLAKALLQKPEILIFDNPFIGLDVLSRSLLHKMINELIRDGVIVFMVTSPYEIPSEITHVLELQHGKVKQIYPRSEFVQIYQAPQLQKFKIAEDKISSMIFPDEESFEIAVEMKNVTVRYGDKKILNSINWKILRGEHWGLLGPNGSGKSTLLSLINGDNPQAYSNDIILFDHKRGSGESIWDIKNKIGYISPELHIFFQRNPSYAEAVSITSRLQDLSGYSQSGTTCFEAIASGFNDQVGSSQQITSLQIKQVHQWMELLDITKFKNQKLHKLSLGEQRIVLLARALVKNPAILILDEPCQGLDKEQTQRFIDVVEAVCNQFNKTLIYVSHYEYDIPKSVTKFLRLEKGRVVE